MTEPIPQADEADVADQTQSVDDDAEEYDTGPELFGDTQDADVADWFDQRSSVECRDD